MGGNIEKQRRYGSPKAQVDRLSQAEYLLF